MPYLAHSLIWLIFLPMIATWAISQNWPKKKFHPHISCCWLISPSALLKRSARAHAAGNAWITGPWANRPGWIDPHIWITVKTPKTHLIGRIRPRNCRSQVTNGESQVHKFRLAIGQITQTVCLYRVTKPEIVQI
jgi:CDP-diacylglycerol pyrophosphatase